MPPSFGRPEFFRYARPRTSRFGAIDTSSVYGFAEVNAVDATCTTCGAAIRWAGVGQLRLCESHYLDFLAESLGTEENWSSVQSALGAIRASRALSEDQFESLAARVVARFVLRSDDLRAR